MHMEKCSLALLSSPVSIKIDGEWLEVGHTNYRPIDREPENGCEIKTSACGESGILMRLIVVKSTEEDS